MYIMSLFIFINGVNITEQVLMANVTPESGCRVVGATFREMPKSEGVIRVRWGSKSNAIQIRSKTVLCDTKLLCLF